MEYKNMREVYKGNIWQIGYSYYKGFNEYSELHGFSFDETMIIDQDKEYMFIKDGCYLYEIISGYVFPFFETINNEGTYGINSECIDVPKYAILDDLYEAQLIEVE